jgi:hypothetical protein
VIYDGVKWVVCHRYSDFRALYKYVAEELNHMVKEVAEMLTPISTAQQSNSDTNSRLKRHQDYLRLITGI